MTTPAPVVDAGALVSDAITEVGAPLAIILGAGLGLSAAVFAVSYGWNKFRGVAS
jgi:hypothetical protein